jgi:N-acyl homoserine lactone hydrolase
MNVTDPIRRVSVVSTGQVQIRPEHVASTWRPTALWLLTSRTWTPPRPINAYVIEHRDGLVLFDTGHAFPPRPGRSGCHRTGRAVPASA